MVATVFLALGLVALLGSFIYRLLPDLDIPLTRRVSGALVINIFLPALNFEVVYQLPIDRTFWQVPLILTVGALACVIVAALVLFPVRFDPQVKGSLVLASAFGNVTYLGLPVLQGLFPEHQLQAMQVAVLAEVTVTSLDLVISSVIAPLYGSQTGRSAREIAKEVAEFPLLWAIAIAAACRLGGVHVPAFVLMAFHFLGAAVSGVMLLVLGMALTHSALLAAVRKPGRLTTPLLVKLVLSPIVVLLLARTSSLSDVKIHAITMEGAMPPQLFALIAAEKAGLDTEYLAVAVLALTALSFVTLPLVDSRF
jgi:malate permease and related proteins